MDLYVTYSPNYLPSLSSVAAACSRNIRLVKSSKQNELSMSPTFEDLKNSNAINCLILNYNPLDKFVNDNLLWEAKIVKSNLYEFYRNTDVEKPKSNKDIQELINLIDERVGNVLSKLELTPLACALWADLYFIMIDNSLFKYNIPERLKNWFNELNSKKAFKNASKLVFENDDKESFKKIFQRLPVTETISIHKSPKANSVHNVEINAETQNAIDYFLKSDDYPAKPCYERPSRPENNVRNILITSALPYVNNVPHLGNLIGSTLSGDFFSRYCRLRGRNVIYLCATDEYGTATEFKAAQEKCSPKEICDKYHPIHKSIYDWFGIEFDHFSRTSNDTHKTVVTELFNSVYKNGFIENKSVEQLYCGSCKMFLADRFVEGTCNFCKYEDARGDQCDKCGKLINATVDLINSRCKICSSSPTIEHSRHLFLDLTNLQSDLENIVANVEKNWSVCAKAITHSWLKEGLKPRCITRDLKWGVNVPLEGMNSKVFYVWFDAVLGYLSTTKEFTEHWKKWWYPSEMDVELYQFMAKDNVPFHSVFLPAILYASAVNSPMKPLTPKCIAAVEYLNYEGQKFSKSRNLGVFGSHAQNCGLHSDYWRFYLASVRPESQDSSFSWVDFVTRCNSELLNNLGNFINRALTFLSKQFDGVVQQTNIHQDREIWTQITHEYRNYCAAMDHTSCSTRDALSCIMSISRLGNGFIQSTKPFSLVKDVEGKPRAAAIISLMANVCVLLGNLLQPFMPCFAEKILNQCNVANSARWIPDNMELLPCFLPPGHRIGEVAPLFEKLSAEFADEMQKKFGGN